MTLSSLVQLVLFALGLSYVVTRSEIGFPLRFVWCLAWRWLYRRIGKVLSPWSLVTCPPCNTWWSAAAVTCWAGYDWYTVVQLAFTACAVMALLQRALGGDIAPADDMESVLGLKEKNDDE